MLCKFTVLHYQERMHKDKLVADLALKSGNDLIPVTLWNNEIQKGTHKQFEKLVGQEVIGEIRPEVFNGQVKFSLVTSVQVTTVTPSKAA